VGHGVVGLVEDVEQEMANLLFLKRSKDSGRVLGADNTTHGLALDTKLVVVRGKSKGIFPANPGRDMLAIMQED
jgi:hypothetical protein